MHFQMATATILSSLLALVFAAADSPSWNDDQGCSSPCMTSQDAHHAAINFQTLITDYSDSLADTYLAPDFIDYSDSVTELINGACAGPQPVGQSLVFRVPP